MFSLVPLFLISPMLAAVAYFDLRYMRIPNVLCLLMLAIIVIWSNIFPPNDLLVRVYIAGAVFGLGFLGFCFRLLGGGDVKVLAVLMLFVPTLGLTLFAYVFSASMLFGVMTIICLRRLPQLSGHHWKSMSGSTGFPMGISIAMTGLLFPIASVALGGF